ncbi:MAG: sialidase family protein [Candidatus Abyssubacteria bacterium]
MLTILGATLAILFAGIGLLILYWRYRPPSDIHLAQSLRVETWTAVRPDAHHAFTDLIKFQDEYILAHATSPWHFASERCRLVIRTSSDAKQWDLAAEIRIPGEDVRDPKLAVIGEKLFLYFLRNSHTFYAEPTGTAYCISDDGRNWTEPQDLATMTGWIIWRPKTRDGITFYAPAYWSEHGKAALFKTTDGVNWSQVGLIYSGDKTDETAISFRPDGSMVMTARLEIKPNRWGYHPEAHTLIGVALPPYTDWKLSRSYITRLDGPCLFQIGEHTYACGRRHVGDSDYMGSVWGAKRTSLYLVLPDRLVFLSDLPSSGDTAYAGAVVEDESVLISYYTSPPNRDYIWLLGMISNSSVEMARVAIADLERLANQRMASTDSARIKFENL